MLTPTRELAIQVAKDFKDIAKRVSIACFYGGSSYNPQSMSHTTTQFSLSQIVLDVPVRKEGCYTCITHFNLAKIVVLSTLFA